MASKLITDDEAAIYDRQIRVWGLDAQKRWVLVRLMDEKLYPVLQSSFLCFLFVLHFLYCRLRAANVLVVGVDGLTGEVMKNIVLAGINSLTLLDDREVCTCMLQLHYYSA